MAFLLELYIVIADAPPTILSFWRKLLVSKIFVILFFDWKGRLVVDSVGPGL